MKHECKRALRVVNKNKTFTVHFCVISTMQIFHIFLALICLKLQTAIPLSASFGNKLHGDREFVESEKYLAPHHHGRHKPSHLLSSHTTGRQAYIEVEKNKSARELVIQATNENIEAPAESLNYQQNLHHQQKPHKRHHSILDPSQSHLDTKLHLYHNNHYKRKKYEKNGNSIHTQRTHSDVHHKNMLKSRSTIAFSSNAATTPDSETPTRNMGLVKSDTLPKANAAHPIKRDEVNKSIKNYNQQPIIRQRHKQQLHPTNHKLQSNSDSSKMKFSMDTVNDSSELVHATLPPTDFVHFITNLREDATKNVTISELNKSVGESTKNTAVRNSESTLRDDTYEYYDYINDDNESNTKSRALAALDKSYYYDSDFDDDYVEWLGHTLKKSKGEHHQHIRQSREEVQRYSHAQSEPPKSHRYDTQKYRNEHLRVARDHHTVQLHRHGHNHLAYETSSDDEYPDDEPYRDSTEQFSNRPGDLTLQKYDELGTMQAVQQTRNIYMQRHKSPFDLATENISRMKVAARCSRPLPRVFQVSNDTSKTYVPSCTILHRCGEDTGCCRSMGQVCTAKTYENIPLHFIVIQLNSSNFRPQTEIEILWLRNDTECHCLNRTDLTPSPEFNTRDKRSGVTFRWPTQANVNTLDSKHQLTSRNYSQENNENDPDTVCRCPRHFDVFQEVFTWQVREQLHNQYSTEEQMFNCRCDCTETGTPCQRFKNGEEGFAMDDRRCIADKICSVPNCSYGTFNEQMGRCPRPGRKHKRHNSEFG